MTLKEFKELSKHWPEDTALVIPVHTETGTRLFEVDTVDVENAVEFIPAEPSPVEPVVRPAILLT